MRKIACLMVLLLAWMPWASAQNLPMAAQLDMHLAFERYASYTLDEQTGEWSAHGLKAAQLLATVEQGDGSGYLDEGVCVLYPGVRGNMQRSLMEPVLYVCLVRYSPIAAQAVSIATGGVRYDFVGAAEKTKIGAYPCERFALPLSDKGLALLKSFGQQGGAVRVNGEQRTFKTAVGEAERYKTSKARVEAMGMAATRDFLDQWPEGYALWDLNEEYWAKDRPEMAVTALGEALYEGLPALDEATQLLDIGKGSAIKAYQQLLKDAAFFTAKPDGSFGKTTRSATKKAQQYYALLPTGLPDRVLMERLAGGEPAAPGENVQLEQGEALVVEGMLSLRLRRAWPARIVAPAKATDAMALIGPTDRSNCLMVVDGEAVNLSLQTVQPGLLVQAALITAQGARYPCSMQVEKDEGRAFDGSLLPQDVRRLVLVCELPPLSIAGCTLTLDAPGAQTLEIALG